MFLRVFLVLYLAINMVGCKSEDEFVIEGVISDGYLGIIYLNFNETRDSCLVKDNKFYFKGKLPDDIATVAYFSTNRTSAMDKSFFLERKNVKVDISIEQKRINTTELDWITVNSVSGTETSLMQSDYEDFKLLNENDTAWRTMNHSKIENIITNHPKHPYSAELLLSLIQSDSLADINELQNIYKKLDIEYQEPISMRSIKRIIYPQESLKIGSKIMDFELMDIEGVKTSILDYRGSLLFIDFWASWCAPCIKEFPKILDIHKAFEDENFKILGVALEENRANWLKAVNKNQLLWKNVIDTTAFEGKIALEYDIHYIPSNILVDEEGIIIAVNLKPAELTDKLKETLK